MTEPAGAWPVCGDCPACLARTNALLTAPPRASILPGVKPDPAALERHAKRFGPEQVAETAAELGLCVKMEAKKETVRRLRGPSLKARVAEYLREGYGVDVIAELENLSPSRARRLVEELRRAS